ncbi:hypothetical protein MKX01_012831 [Papaver californicum]|nr:hypothetical protein MKX01_012831 [Papaver californicum]
MSEKSSHTFTAGIGSYAFVYLKITEDILKSEDQLLALYWKWISIYRPNEYDLGNNKFIDLELEKMFTERFEKFKDTIRTIHTVNSTKGTGWTAGFNFMADFTDNEKCYGGM